MASSTKEKEIKDVQLPFNVRLLQIGHTFIEWSDGVLLVFRAAPKSWSKYTTPWSWPPWRRVEVAGKPLFVLNPHFSALFLSFFLLLMEKDTKALKNLIWTSDLFPSQNTQQQHMTFLELSLKLLKLVKNIKAREKSLIVILAGIQ